MKPNYVAKKSAWSAVSFLWILSCVLIIPIFIIACRIITVKKFSLEFYDDKNQWFLNLDVCYLYY